MKTSEGIKILIAEDNADIRELLADKVAAAGYGVILAEDGQEAWDKIRADDPDVILLDLMMPRLDGFEVLKKLRADPPTNKWQPVIIVSARGELDDMRKGYSLEADHYIIKPFHPHDIIQGIERMIKLIPHRKPRLDS